MSASRRRALRHLRRDLGLRALSTPHPVRTVRARRALRAWGPTFAGAYAAGAARHPRRPAFVDRQGTLDFAAVDRRSTALANGLHHLGVEPSDTVAVMCSNHRGFLDATVACAKLAAGVLYLDPDTPPPVAARAIRRGDAGVLIADNAAARRLTSVPGVRLRVLATPGAAAEDGEPTIESLVARFDGVPYRPPRTRQEPGTVTVAVGAGGAPSALRRLPGSLATLGAAVTRIPLRRHGTTVLATPLAHAWGYFHLTLAARLGSTIVLADPAQPVELLERVDRHTATALVAGADALRDLTRLPRETHRWYRTGSLSVIAVRDGGLPWDVAIPAIERFGDVMYNLRGPALVRLTAGWPTAARGGPPADTQARRVRAPAPGGGFRGVSA